MAGSREVPSLKFWVTSLVMTFIVDVQGITGKENGKTKMSQSNQLDSLGQIYFLTIS